MLKYKNKIYFIQPLVLLVLLTLTSIKTFKKIKNNNYAGSTF
jgi:hypothetical protein